MFHSPYSKPIITGDFGSLCQKLNIGGGGTLGDARYHVRLLLSRHWPKQPIVENEACFGSSSVAPYLHETPDNKVGGLVIFKTLIVRALPVEVERVSDLSAAMQYVRQSS